ncbi:hypothetical protein HELRODRAFT_191140 [Helobdella robusta]|uniref:Uncharacterized protein n=1 Tax=Helobdella robusta TaxID=6412 RepID=T1FSM9_HELRO|nr:hypothetical protein HELRODRAFT_191140 [Helobdella robusta]ESO07329.1 hypothetical protein HELRODRAFT_191140 [Helobdella robusta]
MDNIKKAGLFIQKLFGSQTPPKASSCDSDMNAQLSNSTDERNKRATKASHRRRHTVQLERSVTGDLKFRIRPMDSLEVSDEEVAKRTSLISNRGEDEISKLDSSQIDCDNSDETLVARALARNPSFSYEHFVDCAVSSADRELIDNATRREKYKRSKSVNPSKICIEQESMKEKLKMDIKDSQPFDLTSTNQQHESSQPSNDDPAVQFSSIKISSSSRKQINKNEHAPKHTDDDRKNKKTLSIQAETSRAKHHLHTTENEKLTRKKSNNNLNIKHKLAKHRSIESSGDPEQKLEFPTTPEMLLDYHKHHNILDANEEWLVVELNEYECLIDNLEIIKIIASHSKFFEVSPEELWQEFFEFVEDVPSYDEVINFDVWQEFRDKKYTC